MVISSRVCHIIKLKARLVSKFFIDTISLHIRMFSLSIYSDLLPLTSHSRKKLTSNISEKSMRTSKWKDSSICRWDVYLVHISIYWSCLDYRLAFMLSDKVVIKSLLSQFLISNYWPSFNDKVNVFYSNTVKDIFITNLINYNVLFISDMVLMCN